ncbi:MAG: hypothetical protein GY838_01420 [bacterium]|nr:hypothetical protein [bacterium]
MVEIPGGAVEAVDVSFTVHQNIVVGRAPQAFPQIVIGQRIDRSDWGMPLFIELHVDPSYRTIMPASPTARTLSA